MNHLLDELILSDGALATFTQTMALICTALGVFVFASGPYLAALSIVSFRQVIPFALDFFTAAGLLRLSGHPSATAILTAAIVILIRRVASLSLKHEGVNRK